ncbi:hypothetical protein [Sphingomonas arenae]|uniref:hypothetical protein n=1 Tax=Sphingomonas arenae TaxID=2812555 RepID=UPI0019674B59|nr:hypothetical protein [Sphingomonas arenae]
MASKAPMLAQVASHFVFEGAASDIVRPGEEAEETDVREHSATTEIKRQPLQEFTHEDVDGHLDAMAEQFAKSMSEAFYSTISKAADKSGNVVDGQGQPISLELLLEAFEKIDMSFNDDGSWSAPTIVLSPEQYERIKELDRSGGGDRFQKRIDQIIEVKRAEHNRREAGRVLAG